MGSTRLSDVDIRATAGRAAPAPVAGRDLDARIARLVVITSRSPPSSARCSPPPRTRRPGSVYSPGCSWRVRLGSAGHGSGFGWILGRLIGSDGRRYARWVGVARSGFEPLLSGI